MLNYEELAAQGKAAGFTHVVPLDISTIQLMPEVRDMCATNSCGAYGQKWSCPPGCGTLEECRQRLQGYTEGILVQTVGELEDEMDYESMQETGQRHKEAFERFYAQLRPQYPDMLAVGTGGCTQLQDLHLSRRALPLPRQNGFLHGGLRYAGFPGLYRQQSPLLLRQVYAGVHRLLSAEIGGGWGIRRAFRYFLNTGVTRCQS